MNERGEIDIRDESELCSKEGLLPAFNRGSCCQVIGHSEQGPLDGEHENMTIMTVAQ